MAISQARSRRKKTSGRYRDLRKKRIGELGRDAVEVTIGERATRILHTLGFTSKVRALRVNEANVLDPKTKKTQKSAIVTVKENPANVHFVRRNRLTKGAVIETKLGMARITNRPSQEGTVNAVLVEASK